MEKSRLTRDGTAETVTRDQILRRERRQGNGVWRFKYIVDGAAELGRNPVISKHEIQPEYGDEQVGAGRDYGTRHARPNSQARTETGKYSFPCSADHEQDC